MAEDTKYVGFWARAVATIIDNIWMSIVGLTIVLLAFGREAFIDSTEFSLSASAVLYLLPVVFVITFWRLKSATPGKMLFGMKLVDAETLGPVSTPRLVLRYLAYFISFIPLGLGFFWAAFDKRKQCFHDKIAKTVIIKG